MELSRRNLKTLLTKLDTPGSSATLVSPGNLFAVRAVEDEEHYSDRPAGPMKEDAVAASVDLYRELQDVDEDEITRMFGGTP